MWTVSGFRVRLYRTPNVVPDFSTAFLPEHFSARIASANRSSTPKALVFDNFGTTESLLTARGQE